MLTIKFMKFGADNDDTQPSYTENICIREARAVHVIYEPKLKTRVQCGDAPGECFEGIVGSDCPWNVAYIMNEAGKTIETIR